MKKSILLTLVFIISFLNLEAQETKFGLKGGVNFASLTGDDAEGLDGRTTFHIGAVASIGISEKFAIQPELIYSSQGFTLSEMGIDVTGKLDYINLPIMADINLSQGFSLQVGPQIGFNITDEVEAEGQTESLDAESIDFGLAGGAQFKMDSGLFFQARYAMGLNDVASDGNVKNSVLSVSLGYFF